jgi:hypothetical protein
MSNRGEQKSQLRGIESEDATDAFARRSHRWWGNGMAGDYRELYGRYLILIPIAKADCVSDVLVFGS